MTGEPIAAGLLPTAPSPLARPMQTLLRTLEASTPVEQVIHSYHWDALKHPAVATHPAMIAFTAHELLELHSKQAAAGYARRLATGRATVEEAEGLTENLQLMIQQRLAASRALARLARFPVAAMVPAVQRLQVSMEVGNRMLRRALPRIAAIMRTVEPLAEQPWM